MTITGIDATVVLGYIGDVVSAFAPILMLGFGLSGAALLLRKARKLI